MGKDCRLARIFIDIQRHHLIASKAKGEPGTDLSPDSRTLCYKPQDNQLHMEVLAGQ